MGSKVPSCEARDESVPAPREVPSTLCVILAWTCAENFAAATAPTVFLNSDRAAFLDLERIDFL